MKQLFLMLAIIGFALNSQAQNIVNNSTCAIEFRPVCVSSTCVTSGSAMWLLVTPNGGSRPLPVCANNSTAYQVRYLSTGPCGTVPAVMVYQGPPSCPIPNITPMGPCATCSSNPFGLIADFTTTNLIIN